jgi:host factor-I protein
MVLRSPGDPDSGRPAGYPPDDTRQEAAYLKSLGEKQRPVHIKLMDGEVVCGWIEYYDRRMIRLTRDGAPNLFIYKHDIAYIAEEPLRRPIADARRGSRAAATDPATVEPVDPTE